MIKNKQHLKNLVMEIVSHLDVMKSLSKGNENINLWIMAGLDIMRCLNDELNAPD